MHFKAGKKSKKQLKNKSNYGELLIIMGGLYLFIYLLGCPSHTLLYICLLFNAGKCSSPKMGFKLRYYYYYYYCRMCICVHAGLETWFGCEPRHQT